MARRNPTVRGCLLAWLAVFGLASQLMAQPETTPRPAPPVRAERKANAPRDDLRYLHGPDGRLVPVLDKAAYDEFLKWQESREHPGPPASAITRLRLEGTAENDRVLLTARIDVTLSVDDEWVQVPLAFTEAQLVDEVRHTGPGEHSPGPFETDTGLSWWLRGKGKHELEVKLQVPATAKAGPRRLSLSLPHSAVGTCKVRIPAPRITAKTSDRATLTTRPVGQETEVEIVGLDGRLELAWQTLPQVSTAPAALEVNTSVSLTLVQGEGATIEATQKIQTVGQQGTIERVRVRIPHGTELSLLEGTEFQSSQPVDNSPDTYDVLLKKGVPREVELRYTLHAPSPAPGEPFELDGFDVESATAQSGHVAVTVVGDLRAVRGLDSEKFIHRVNVSDLPTSLRQPQTSLAFRYFKRLKLSLRFEPVALQASVEPESMILIRPKLVELISLQKLQIRRGSLTKVVIHWPGRKAAGWSNPTITLPNGGEATIVKQDEAGDALEIEIPEPLTGNVVLRLRSQRALEDPREKLDASLPICDIKERHPAVVSVYSTEDIETQLEPLANTQLRPASTRPPPVEASGLVKREEQVVEPADGPFQLTAERHNRRALSKCVVAIRLDDRSIKVNQRPRDAGMDTSCRPGAHRANHLRGEFRH
ncbi:MAG: hypothetical protein NT069_04905 [Planctomycetota bacterium]|nr:hypothetical protein [Planctomycetota bacterium]